MKPDDNSFGEALPIRGNSSSFQGIAPQGSSACVCSLSEQLSEVVAENHERYSLAQRLAIKHEGLEQELPVIDLVIPCIENA